MQAGDFLPVEAVAETIIVKPLMVVHTARTAGEFGIDVEVSNHGSNTLAWTSQHPITLSYRWFDMATGEPFPLEGSRAQFEDFLRPGSRQKLHLVVKTPAFHGMATLRVSCVCEGRFWFYDVFSTGWADMGLDIIDPAVWPTDLRGSMASRALRGAVAANALHERLLASPIRCALPSPIEDPGPDPVTSFEEATPAAGFIFRPAPVVELHHGYMDASPPASWPGHAVTVDDPVTSGWRAWIRHPIITLGHHINRALAQSSLGQRLDAGQLATADLLERLRQSVDNDRHTQAMLRDILRHQEQRDAYYAEMSHNQLNLVQQELSTLVSQQIRDAQNGIVERFDDHGKAQATESREISNKMLRSVLDALRCINLNLLKIDEDIERRRGRDSALHATTYQAGIDGILQDLGTLRQELDILVRLEMRDTQTVIVQEFRDQARKQTAQRQEASDQMLRAVIDMLRRINLDMLDDIRTSIATVLHDMHGSLQAVGDAMSRMQDAHTDFAVDVSTTMGEIQSESRLYGENLQRHMSKLADREALASQLAHIVESLQKVESFNSQEIDNLAKISSALINVRDFIETDFGYAFTKIDALLHRQSFSTPGSNKIICRNALGLFAIPENDLETISYYVSGYLPEPGSLALVQKLLNPGDTFVDVGANVGLFTVAAGRKVGDAGCIFAFEPAPETMAALTDTLRLNGLSSIVTLHQSAAGRENGTAQLHVGRICGHSSLLPLEEKRETIDISIVALDDILGDRKVDLIKIDIEGWELEALEGLRKTLANNEHASVLMEFGISHIKRAGSNPRTWVEKIRTFGLNIYEIDEENASVVPLRSEGLEDIVSINLLLSRAPANLLNQE